MGKVLPFGAPRFEDKPEPERESLDNSEPHQHQYQRLLICTTQFFNVKSFKWEQCGDTLEEAE